RVREVSSRAPQHAVLVVAESGRPEPQRALVLIEQVTLSQQLEGMVDLALLVERVFGEEAVHVHAETLERLLDALDHQLDSPPCQLVRISVGGALYPLRELRDVLAPIAVLGRLFTASACL